MGDLASKLDAIRSTAQAQKAVSMEVYLGRLPYLEALLFRNTFFPMWDLLVQQVFGKATGPLSGLSELRRSILQRRQGRCVESAGRRQPRRKRGQRSGTRAGCRDRPGRSDQESVRRLEQRWHPKTTGCERPPDAAGFPHQGPFEFGHRHGYNPGRIQRRHGDRRFRVHQLPAGSAAGAAAGQ